LARKDMAASSHSVCWTGDSRYVVVAKCILSCRRYHNPDASLEEGLATLKRCIDEVAKRLVVSPDRYKIKVVDKDGIREVEL
jgi:20S proteasome alpha/beta subunit